MNLIDRYLDELGSYLPRGVQEEVTRELRSKLETALEEKRSGGQWRSEEEAEVELLKDLGPPHELAEAHVPKPRILFGPRLYPAFLRTMKIALAVLIGLALLGLATNLMDSPSLFGLGEALVTAFKSILTGALVILGITVVVFAVIERTATPAPVDKADWDPRSLPPTDDPDRFKPVDHVASIVFLVVALVVLNLFRDRIGLPLTIGDERGWIPILGPAFSAQLWLLNLCLGLDLLVQFIVLLRWRWSTALRWANFAVNGLYVFWLGRLVFGPSIFAVDPDWLMRHGWSAEAAAQVQELTAGALGRIVRINLRIGFYAAVAALGYQLFKLILRMFARS